MNRGFQQVMVRDRLTGRWVDFRQATYSPPQPFPGRPKLLALMVNRICRQWGALR